MTARKNTVTRGAYRPPKLPPPQTPPMTHSPNCEHPGVAHEKGYSIMLTRCLGCGAITTVRNGTR